MKLQRLALIVLLLIIVGAGLWWFRQPTAIIPEKGAAGSIPAKFEAMKQAAPTAQVELPKAPVVPASAGTAAALAAPIDPQADLTTAFQDIARLLRAGDVYAFRKTYTPPVLVASPMGQQMLQHLQEMQAQNAQNQNPQTQPMVQQINEGAAEAYEALETQTPTFNAAGDEATYTYTLPSPTGGEGSPISRTFIKINGKWYLKQ